MIALSTAFVAGVAGATDGASVLLLDEGDQVLLGVLQIAHARGPMAVILNYLHAGFFGYFLLHGNEAFCLGVCQAKNKLLVPPSSLLPG